jgi:Bacterial PH domain
VENIARRPLPRPAEVRFVPDRRYTALAGGGAFGALAALLLTTDAAGRVLFAVAAVVLGAYVASDLVFSPRVVASGAGIVIRAPLTRARLRWDDVDDVRAETRFRRGLRSTTLEIDAGQVLAVFSQRALGVSPVQAAALIDSYRPR